MTDCTLVLHVWNAIPIPCVKPVIHNVRPTTGLLTRSQPWFISLKPNPQFVKLRPIPVAEPISISYLLQYLVNVSLSVLYVLKACWQLYVNLSLKDVSASKTTGLTSFSCLPKKGRGCEVKLVCGQMDYFRSWITCTFTRDVHWLAKIV